jgi:hypothetical protein
MCIPVLHCVCVFPCCTDYSRAVLRADCARAFPHCAGDAQLRCSKKRRVGMLQALCINGFDGRPHAEMEQRWAKSKRFKVARLAKASDVDSNFNPTAVGAMRACEGDVGKGEMGLSCGASSTRRRQARVHQLAASLGWSSMVDGTDGECWSWGFEGQTFKKGVNLYLKLTHYDLHHEDVSKAKPWLICCAGDGTRSLWVSWHGAVRDIGQCRH